MTDPERRTLLTALIAFGGPAVIFALVATSIERRWGARWLPWLWALALGVLGAVTAAGLHRSPRRLALAGGYAGPLIAGLSFYAVGLAAGALVVWRRGRHAARPWPAVGQAAGAFGASVLGYLATVAAVVLGSVALDAGRR